MPRTKETVALAYKVLRTIDGRFAFEDGWGSALWHFIADNGREPTASEIEDLKRDAARVTRSLLNGPAWAREVYERKIQRLKGELYGRSRADA